MTMEEKTKKHHVFSCTSVSSKAFIFSVYFRAQKSHSNWLLLRFQCVGMNQSCEQCFVAPPLTRSSSALCLQTSLSLFKSQDFAVKRRFSDFLGLHGKLASKYLHVGYIVPPAPEKSIMGKWNRSATGIWIILRLILPSASVPAGMTKVKVGKEDQSSNEFVEKRRSALERWACTATLKSSVFPRN